MIHKSRHGHLRKTYLKEDFNSIDFYCSANFKKTSTELLNGFRHERKKTFQLFVLIVQTTCAVNFKQLLSCKPHRTQQCLHLRSWLFFLLYTSSRCLLGHGSHVEMGCVIQQMLGPQQPVEASYVYT